MQRFGLAIVCAVVVVAVVVMTIGTPWAGAAEWTVQSVDAHTGAVTAKDAKGESITVVADRAAVSGLRPGQVVSIDAAQRTMTLAIPVRVQPGGGFGVGLKPDSSHVPALQTSNTAGAIRGRPESSAREFPNMVGEFSPASENPNGEADEVIDLSKFVLPAPARSGEPQKTSSAVTISDYPRGGGGGDLVARLAKGLKDKEIDVALLGGQKYMIADCLGVKASAGKFRLKLANPEAKIDGTGALLKFAIDEVSWTALKVRTQPSANLNPCTWGNKVEVGGWARDVRLEIRIDPILDLERCRVANPGQVRTQVRIGDVNFKGINNELDKAAKNMVEDSITFALQFLADAGSPNTFVNQLIQTLDDILEVDCPGNPGGTAKGIQEAAQNVGVAATAAPDGRGGAGAGAGGLGGEAKMPANTKLPGTGASVAAPAGRAAEGKPFTMVINPALKGRLGRLVIVFPEGSKGNADTRYDVYKPGEDKPVQGGYGKAELDLIPGTYVVAVAQKKVADVEIASRQDTRLRTGAIRVNAGKDTRVDILDADKKTKLVGGYGVCEWGLPVGTYHVQIAGSVESVTIEEGKLTEF